MSMKIQLKCGQQSSLLIGLYGILTECCDRKLIFTIPSSNSSANVWGYVKRLNVARWEC